MLHIINVVVEIINIVYCLEILLNRNLQINRRMLFLIFMDGFIFWMIEEFGIDEKYQFFIYPLIVFYMCIQYKLMLFKALEILILSIAIISVIQFGISSIFFVFNIHMEIFPVIILQIITLVLIYFFRTILSIIGDFANQSKILDKIIISLFPIGIVIILFKYKRNIGIEKRNFIIILLGGVLIGKLVYDWQKEKIELNIKKAELRISESYYDSFKELIMAIRKRQHDFNNHLQAIYALHYSTNNYQELVLEQRKYLKDISYSDEFYKLLNIQNPILSGFIYQKIIDADSKNYAVFYDVKLHNKVCSIPEYILIEIVGILWDNAIEAGEELGNKKIRLIASDSEKQLQFSIANPIENISYVQIFNFFTLGNTTKGKNRGIGLWKIKEYENKYKFDIMVTKEQYETEYWLCIKIIIPN